MRQRIVDYPPLGNFLADGRVGAEPAHPLEESALRQRATGAVKLRIGVVLTLRRVDHRILVCRSRDCPISRIADELAVERLLGLCAMEPRTDKIPGKFLLGNFLCGRIPAKFADDAKDSRSSRFLGGRTWAKVHAFTRWAEFFSAPINFLEICFSGP